MAKRTNGLTAPAVRAPSPGVLSLDGVTAIVGWRTSNGWSNGVRLVTAPEGVYQLLEMPTLAGGAANGSGRPLSDGFEWGYTGTGPHALSVALLALVAGVAFEGAEDALRAAGWDVYGFMRYFVSRLPRDVAGGEDWRMMVEDLRVAAESFHRTERS